MNLYSTSEGEELLSDSLEEFTEISVLLDRLSRLEKAHTKAKSELRIARKQSAALSEDVEANNKLLDAYEASRRKTIPTWLTPKKPKKSSATVVAMMSDLHLDEVVDLDEMGGANKYDRCIAEMRLKRFVDKTIELSDSYIDGVSIDGLCLLWGGDMCSGDVHEELAQTNEGVSGLDTCVYWSPILAACVTKLADFFGKVHISSVVGNHGRQTRKPRMKGRVRDNLDFLLATMIANLLEKDARITWDIPDTADCLVSVYNTRILLTHGDQIRGGGNGVGGLMAPVLRMVDKKRLHQPFDVMAFGHFHQQILDPGNGVFACGSSKGVDEFSRLMNFRDCPPLQAYAVVTPTNGFTFTAPIFVQDKEKEGW